MIFTLTYAIAIPSSLQILRRSCADPTDPNVVIVIDEKVISLLRYLVNVLVYSSLCCPCCRTLLILCVFVPNGHLSTKNNLFAVRKSKLTIISWIIFSYIFSALSIKCYRNLAHTVPPDCTLLYLYSSNPLAFVPLLAKV